MILKSLFKPREQIAETLYRAIVAVARQPRFYADWGVPDTLDGRFDMISLHVFMVVEALQASRKAEAATLTQQLTDVFFQDMDRSLREMGVGDLSVGKKVRKMAEVYFGRVTAYAAALRAEEPALQDALARNIYAGMDPSTAAANAGTLARWVRAAHASLPAQLDGLMKGEISLP